MKKYWLTLIVCLLTLGSLKAQSTMISFQPNDKGYGIGLRTDNVYVCLSQGTYKLTTGYMEHSKVVFGGVYNPQNNLKWGQYTSFVTFGLCLHSYNNQSLQEFKRIVTYPVSMELGAGGYLNKLSIAFRFDIIKNESSIDIGIKF